MCVSVQGICLFVNNPLANNGHWLPKLYKMDDAYCLYVCMYVRVCVCMWPVWFAEVF